jgi:hypothetical protein
MQAVPRQLQHINTPTAGRVTGDANTDTAVQHQAAHPICATNHPPTRQQSGVTLTQHSMQQGSRGMQAAHRQLQRTNNLSTASVTDQADSTDTRRPVQHFAATAISSTASPRRPLQQAGWQHHKTTSRCIAAYTIYTACHMHLRHFVSSLSLSLEMQALLPASILSCFVTNGCSQIPNLQSRPDDSPSSC